MVALSGQEIELKLRVPAGHADAVRAAVTGRNGADRTHLQAAYVDTPSHALAAAGMGWRVRREGRQWVQTLKAHLADGGDGLRREEHNVVVRGRTRPVADASLHAGTPAGRSLSDLLEQLHEEPVEQFHTDVWRLSRTVKVKGGTVELAFDEGEIVSGDRRTPVSELELELKSGTPRAVLATARTWIERHELWLDGGTKAQRGMFLASGADVLPVVKSPRPDLRPDMSVDAALREITRACLVQIMGNASAVAAGMGDHEHVHQARVGIRKLRTALAEFGRGRSTVDPAWSTRLADVFEALGESRDREVVLAGWLDELRAAGAPELQLAPSTGRDPGEVLRAPSFSLLMIDLLEYVHGDVDDADDDGTPLRAVVARRLTRLRRRSLKLAPRFASLSPLEQHEVRKQVKRLRYVAELTEALFPERKVRRYVRGLGAVQDTLGRLNDLEVAAGTFRGLTEGDGAAWFAVGWLEARRAATVAACLQPLRDAQRAVPYWKR